MVPCDKRLWEEATLFIATRFVTAHYYFFLSFKTKKKQQPQKTKQEQKSKINRQSNTFIDN